MVEEQLPNAHDCLIEVTKIVGYLLNIEHESGGTKAAYFLSHGYTIENWHELANDLKDVALYFPVSLKISTPRGEKYVIDGQIETPNRRIALVRTVWLIEASSKTPRLITAYPVR